MRTDVVQRWRDRRGVYRTAREPFDPHRCEGYPRLKAGASAG